MNLNKLTILLLICSVCFSCSTGKKALQQGNYTQAVIQAVERLRENPDSKKAKTTLKQAYPLALQTLQVEIGQLMRSNDPFKYGEVVHRFEAIQTMADEIRRCPPAMQLLGTPETFPEDLAEARLKAAPEAYEAAIKLLREGNRDAAREAFYLFQDADRYVSNYRDVRQKIEEARSIATLKVVVEQIPVPGRYQISSVFFYNQVFGFLNEGIRKEFITFYSPEEAKKLPYVDEILVMEFYDFTVGNTRDSESQKEMTSKDSVKVGSATLDGKKVDVFDRVKAKYTVHKREISSSGQLKAQILDARTKKVLSQRLIPGTFTWVNEWASYNGDERALTPEQKEMCKRKSQLPPPTQDLFLEFTKPIFDQLKGFIRSWYKNQ